VNGALKAAWGLTAFVVLAGIAGWILTGRAVFAVFLVLGLLTAVGAWVSGRGTPAPPSSSSKGGTP
jgi:dolichol kinase